MYRNLYESKFTVKTVNANREFSVKEIIIPEKCDTEKAMIAARKAYKPEPGVVVLWKSFNLVSITETPYAMSDDDFLAFADKIEKPNPSLITRTVNNTVVKFTVVNDDETFTEASAAFNGKIDGEKLTEMLENQIKKRIPVFR